jgi:hypothetical protein
MNTYQMLNPESFTPEYEEERRVLRELAEESAPSCINACEHCDEDICNDCEHYIPVHMVDSAMDNERDLFDIVREHEESEDRVSEASDYLDCNFEE